MNAKTHAYFSQLLADLHERAAEDDDHTPITVLEDPEDEDLWIQVSPSVLDMRYPFEDSPETELQNLQVEVPPSLEILEWGADGHLALGYEESMIDDAAQFLAAYADSVFERSPVGWNVEEDCFEGSAVNHVDDSYSGIAQGAVDYLVESCLISEDEKTAQPPKKEWQPHQKSRFRSLIIGCVIFGVIFAWRGALLFVSFHRTGLPEDQITVGEDCYLRHCEFPGLRKMKADSTAQPREGVLLAVGSFVSPIACQNDWIQVETPDGYRGFIPPLKSDDKSAGIIEKLPRINPGFAFCTTYDRMRAGILGKELDAVERHYGPASSILMNGPNKEAYFQYIDSTRDGRRYKGMFLVLDGSDKVVDVQPDALVDSPRIAGLPLVGSLRKVEFFRLNYRSFYDGTRWCQVLIDSLIKMVKGHHWSVRWTVRIILMVIVLLVYLAIFLIPCLLAYPFTLAILHWPRLNNGVALLLIAGIDALLFYVFFLYREVPDGSWWSSIILLFVFAFWVRLSNSRINYDRCPNCHLMNTALDMGSTFLGETENVSVRTYDVYKGRRETDTEIIKMYERRKREKRETFDNFEDHRKCSRCGCVWDVSREVKTSETNQEI